VTIKSASATCADPSMGSMSPPRRTRNSASGARHLPARAERPRRKARCPKAARRRIESPSSQSARGGIARRIERGLGPEGQLSQAEARIHPRPDAIQVAVVFEDVTVIVPVHTREFIAFAFPARITGLTSRDVSETGTMHARHRLACWNGNSGRPKPRATSSRAAPSARLPGCDLPEAQAQSSPDQPL
jgi:hypothetical protein